MKKQILAASIGAVLIVAFIVPSLSTSSAQTVSTESRVEAAILALTQVIKGQVTDLISTLSNIEDDLEFKKKFYEITGGSSVGIAFGLEVVRCTFDAGDPSACAFNVESVQFGSPGPNVTAIEIDGVVTDITPEIQLPSNVMVDSGIGKVGVADSIVVQLGGVYVGPFHFDGEKPQGMELCLFEINAMGKRDDLSPACPD
jgi:hypothetical protein